jgi:hypothetical protein
MGSRSVCEVCGLFWGVTLLGGTAYLNAAHGWSPWWFLLSGLLALSWSCKGTKP